MGGCQEEKEGQNSRSLTPIGRERLRTIVITCTKRVILLTYYHPTTTRLLCVTELHKVNLVKNDWARKRLPPLYEEYVYKKISAMLVIPL